MASVSNTCNVIATILNRYRLITDRIQYMDHFHSPFLFYNIYYSALTSFAHFSPCRIGTLILVFVVLQIKEKAMPTNAIEYNCGWKIEPCWENRALHRNSTTNQLMLRLRSYSTEIIGQSEVREGHVARGEYSQRCIN